MKISKVLLSFTVAAATGLASLQAGSAPAPAMSAPVAPAATSHGLLGDVAGELSSGFDSHYIFRGANLGENAVWTGLNLAVPIADGLDLGLGAWYINPTEGGADDELDLFASLGTSFGGVDVSLGYTAYLYPEDNGDTTNEINVAAGTEVMGVSVGGQYAYDFDLETHYFEASAGYGVELTDIISADFSVALGFTEDNYSHTTVSLAFPIALADGATLTPYVAGVFPDEEVHGGSVEDEIFGGASLSVSF